jgi:hypothetical protein
MKNNPNDVRREVYPKPEHRFPNAEIGMRYQIRDPTFPCWKRRQLSRRTSFWFCWMTLATAGRASAEGWFECRWPRGLPDRD